jgi:predicted molibdopterin-dependent oxidoreductase YjgC
MATGVRSRDGETVLRAPLTDRMLPGAVYTTFHHPESGANVVTTENADWATKRAMDAHKLVKMANGIASFFESEPDRAVALERHRRPPQAVLEPSHASRAPALAGRAPG